jgi:glyoxylase-like metal-dependent hydrolase (beta-lactamase superfamily II)
MALKVITLDHQFLDQANSIGSFILESRDGPILVESGPHSTYPTLQKAIVASGYKVEDIKHVLLTHIHFDHAGAAWVFADKGAQIYVHTLGFKHMNDPSRLYASAKMIYQDKMEYLWGDMKAISADLLTEVKDGDTLKIGEHTIDALYTPGHAKHHLAYRVDDVVFTGDVAGARINHGPVVPPCPPPDIGIELWLTSIDKLLDLDGVKRYYLTHYGEITDIEDHMAALQSCLLEYKAFIEPYFRKGSSPEDILPEFMQFVDDRLRRLGMTDEDEKAYQGANPADMSVPGLLRYWAKKEG